MSDPAWERIAELFERAVALPRPERTLFLERACGDDPDLLARVRQLLDVDADPPRVLDATPEQLAESLVPPPTPALEGWRVGPYRLQRELGHGGMGVVYLAARDDLHSTVALKLLRHLPGAPELGERFRREQVVHAQLEHRYIARLLDAGVADDGTPWFAMDYVEGCAIDVHCDERRLSVADRLALFEKVGEAVAYAHRNLVVHRDLKPSNILVTPEGEPRLVDFGIAKLIAPDGRRSGPGHTAGGAFTLAVASPEQLRGEPVTTTTDVYQLGLLLHQLLTGLPACSAPGRTLGPAARLTDQEAVRPSTLARLDPGPARESGTHSAAARADLRGTTPERLGRALEGDLDAIVLKALRPDPAHRYLSAEHLVEDVRRHRDGLPVVAASGTLRYRIGKLVRRHRVTSALLAVLVLLLIGGVSAVGIQMRRVARERDRTDQFSHLLEGLIYGADPLRAGDSLTARALLDRTVPQARARLLAEPRIWGRLLVVVGRTYQSLGYLDQAIAIQQEVLDALRANGIEEYPLTVEALRSLGVSQARTGRFADAVATLENAVSLSAARGRSGRLHLGAGLGDLALARDLMGQLDSAATLYRNGLAVLATLPDSGGAEFDRLSVDLGNLLFQGSRLAEAESLMVRAVTRLTEREGMEAGATLRARTELADIMLKRGRLAEGEQMAAEVLAIRRRLNPGPHEQLADALLQHGRSMAERGRWVEAEADMTESVKIWRQLGDEESVAAAFVEVQLADVLKRAGEPGRALPLEQHALRIFQAKEGVVSTGAVYTSVRLAHTEHLLGQLDRAERRFRETLPLLDSTPAGQGRLVRPFTDFGDLLADRGRCVEAEGYLRRAMTIAERGWGSSHPVSLRPRRLLGNCLAERRQFEMAESVLLPGYRSARAAGEYAPKLTREMATALVGMYERWGRLDRAEPYRGLASR